MIRLRDRRELGGFLLKYIASFQECQKGCCKLADNINKSRYVASVSVCMAIEELISCVV